MTDHHTATPWRATIMPGPEDKPDYWAIFGNGELIAGMDDWDDGTEQRTVRGHHNARRVVAAVNATASVSTAALEAGIVVEMLAALEWYAKHHIYRVPTEWSDQDLPNIWDDRGLRARAVLARLAAVPQEATDAPHA